MRVLRLWQVASLPLLDRIYEGSVTKLEIARGWRSVRFISSTTCKEENFLARSQVLCHVL